MAPRGVRPAPGAQPMVQSAPLTVHWPGRSPVPVRSKFMDTTALSPAGRGLVPVSTNQPLPWVRTYNPESDDARIDLTLPVNSSSTRHSRAPPVVLRTVSRAENESRSLEVAW